MEESLSVATTEDCCCGKTAAFIALGLVITLYGLRKYLAGGRCYIEKDMTGEVAVITGGNSGIGKETARKLVRSGCTVVFGARDKTKNENTVRELSKEKGRIVGLSLDLSDKKSIEQFGKEVREVLEERPINYLINNAGLMAIPERKVTTDGF